MFSDSFNFFHFVDTKYLNDGTSKKFSFRTFHTHVPEYWQKFSAFLRFMGSCWMLNVKKKSKMKSRFVGNSRHSQSFISTDWHCKKFIVCWQWLLETEKISEWILQNNLQLCCCCLFTCVVDLCLSHMQQRCMRNCCKLWMFLLHLWRIVMS